MLVGIVVDTSHSTADEVNRIYDAWIPSDSTARFLSQRSAPTESVHLLPDQILRPRLAMADTQVGYAIVIACIIQLAVIVLLLISLARSRVS